MNWTEGLVPVLRGCAARVSDETWRSETNRQMCVDDLQLVMREPAEFSAAVAIAVRTC